jgi:hypothetical protein
VGGDAIDLRTRLEELVSDFEGREMALRGHGDIAGSEALLEVVDELRALLAAPSADAGAFAPVKGYVVREVDLTGEAHAVSGTFTLSEAGSRHLAERRYGKRRTGTLEDAGLVAYVRAVLSPLALAAVLLSACSPAPDAYALPADSLVSHRPEMVDTTSHTPRCTSSGACMAP